jgi:TolB protein
VIVDDEDRRTHAAILPDPGGADIVASHDRESVLAAMARPRCVHSVAAMTPHRWTGLALTGLLVLAAGAATADATAPGRNGAITFRRYLGPDRTIGAIFTINPDGSGERQVTSPPAGASDDFPDTASDGSWIAFERCAEFCRVFTVRSDGTGERPITPGCKPGEAPPQCTDDFYPAISPDGKLVAFSHAFGVIRDDLIDHLGIYAVRADGSHLRRITLPPSRVAEDNEAQWSPDGHRLVFVRELVKSGKRAIFTVRANGQDLRRVTPWELDAGDGPDWSPDGSRILFRSPQSDDFLNSQLYTIRPDGTGLKQITHVPEGTHLYSASFSPDGKSITLGLEGVDGQADVYRMNADGTGVTPVTRTSAWDSAPDWGGVRRR